MNYYNDEYTIKCQQEMIEKLMDTVEDLERELRYYKNMLYESSAKGVEISER